MKSLQRLGRVGEILMKRSLLSVFCFFLMLTPVLAAAVPVHSTNDSSGGEAWWETTNMDKNGAIFISYTQESAAKT